MIWNSLQVGDRVLVHASTAAPDRDATTVRAGTYPLQAGTVAIVDASATAHHIGVAVGNDATHGDVTWPSRLRMHLDPRDVEEPCWWCDQVARL